MSRLVERASEEANSGDKDIRNKERHIGKNLLKCR